MYKIELNLYNKESLAQFQGEVEKIVEAMLL